jgi:hypothetical protein
MSQISVGRQPWRVTRSTNCRIRRSATGMCSCTYSITADDADALAPCKVAPVLALTAGVMQKRSHVFCMLQKMRRSSRAGVENVEAVRAILRRAADATKSEG